MTHEATLTTSQTDSSSTRLKSSNFNWRVEKIEGFFTLSEWKWLWAIVIDGEDRVATNFCLIQSTERAKCTIRTMWIWKLLNFYLADRPDTGALVWKLRLLILFVSFECLRSVAAIKMSLHYRLNTVLLPAINLSYHAHIGAYANGVSLILPLH